MKRKSLLFLLLMAMFAPLAMMGQETLTIYEDGGTTSSNVPVHGLWADAYLKCEFVVPADQLGEMTGGTISQMDFYLTSPAAAAWTGTFQVFLMEVDDATISAYYGPGNATIVYEGQLDGTQSTMTVAFTENYTYGGSNLLVGVYQIVKGSYKSATFAGASVTGASGQGYNSSSLDNCSFAQRNFVPKTTFTYTPGGGSVCEKPESLEATNATENGATLTWTGGSGTYNVEYKLASDTEWTSFVTNTTSTTCNLTGLTPGTAYQARVQSVCEGDATSGWKSVNFTTACGAITTFPWTETFESYASGNFEDPCWVNEHIEGSGTNVFKVYTSAYNDNTTHMLQLPDQAAGTITKLVLPEMTLPSNYEFSIDVCRTNNTYQSYPYELEGIHVYASTDGEIEGATELAFIPRHYQVSNDIIPAEAATGWYTYELPIGMSGTCYIILQGVNQYCTATYMDNLTVKAMPTCLKPTGLAVTANSVTAHNATITWNENGEANTWIVEFATDDEFSDVLNETVEDTPTLTFQGLAPETTYYVRVKAHCGPGDESEYSNVVHFTTAIACPAPTGLAANPGNYTAALSWNGTNDNYIVNYRTAAYAEGIVEEFNVSGVPSGWTRYSGMVDDVIAGEATLSTTTSGWTTNSYALGQYNMKVNIYGTSCKYWLVTPEFNLSQNLSFDLALTDFGNADPIEVDTVQADDRFVVLIYADEAWRILREWNNSGSEYVYNRISTTGENVTIDLSAYYGQDVKIAFYGESTSSTGINAGDNDLHIDNVICGIPYAAGEWQTVTVDETTATITDLTPLKAYEARVLSDCGELDSLSLWTSVITFTTLEGCPVPQNVDVDDIAYNNATVTWDGYNNSYKVSYRTAAYVDGVIENFDASTLPSGWTKWSGLVDYVLTDSIQLSTATGGWYTNNTNALGTYNAKVNIYGTTCKYWLVSPEFRPSQDLNFDLALTKYNSADPIANDTLQSDDRFIVLIYANDAWHILREWNNSGSDYVYNRISATGENVALDLSAYYGKNVKIAFYGESTNPTGMANTGGDNDLHIDNIMCGVPYDASEWRTIEAEASPVILTDLTPGMDYEVKVQGFCDVISTEESEVVTFTTLPYVTLTKDIIGVGEDDWNSNSNGGYYLIASPMMNTITPSEDNGFITEAFDLYYFDEGVNDLEWRNYAVVSFDIVSGKGYLYASKEDTQLQFTGIPYSGNGEVTLQKRGTNFEGWNLVGNPFNETAYLPADCAFYTMQNNGSEILPATSSSIEAMEAVFVVAENDGETLVFSTTAPEAKSAMIALNLNNRNGLIDRAIIRFDEGSTLPKFQLRSNSTKLYIPQDGNNYAVVRGEGMGAMPVNFKAESNGNYTITLSSEEVSFAYLHLIDKVANTDVDLLANPSYTFDAQTTDFANRFELVFATSNGTEEDSFVFFSNGSFVVNNNGDATLQVIDVNGRVLTSENINGCANVNLNAAAGVYMIRLVNGDNVKVQKVVVR